MPHTRRTLERRSFADDPNHGCHYHHAIACTAYKLLGEVKDNSTEEPGTRHGSAGSKVNGNNVGLPCTEILY
jgi:hypothetical protein